jgi:hypothetical protein
VRILSLIAALILTNSPALAKTDAEKAAERAAKDSVATAKQLAKVAAAEEAKRPASVVIASNNVQRIQGAMVARLSENGWNPTRKDEFSATFEQPLKPTIGNILSLGTRSSAKTMATFTFIAVDGGTRVLNSGIDIVADPGSYKETHHDYTLDPGSKAKVQALLDQVKTTMDSAPHPDSSSTPTR